MLVSIGLILVFKQFTHLVGVDKDAFSYHEITLFFSLGFLTEFVSSFHVGVLLLSITSILLFYTWSWLGKKYPHAIFEYLSAPLLIVFYGIFLNNFIFTGDLMIAGDHLLNLNLTGGINSLKDMIRFPDWDAITRRDVWQVAVTLAIIATLESLLSVDAADKLSQHRMISKRNKELFAQGSGNLLSGLLGGLPLTAVIVRTSANINAGAQSRISTILHGLWLVFFIVIIPSYLSLIPLASLSVILLATGLKLANAKIFQDEFKRGFGKSLPFFITIISVFLFDLLVGIFIVTGKQIGRAHV